LGCRRGAELRRQRVPADEKGAMRPDFEDGGKEGCSGENWDVFD
jgi:hypothetical protein